MKHTAIITAIALAITLAVWASQERIMPYSATDASAASSAESVDAHAGHNHDDHAEDAHDEHAEDDEDGHADHDHAAHEDAEKQDVHEGHDHAEHAEAAGRDDHAEEEDVQADHDHAAHEDAEKQDVHEGHDHAEHAEAAGRDDHAEEEDVQADHDHAAHEDAAHEDVEKQDVHEGHDHAEHAEAAGRDDHAEEEDVHAGHDHGTESDAIVHVEKDDFSRWGLEVTIAAPASLDKKIQLPGEVRLNEDRMAHIVPPAKGIVRKVTRSVGDEVRQGDVLAWVESAELSEAKIDYMSRLSELGCCLIDLERAEKVHENTTRFLELLQTGPSLERLQAVNGAVMGDYRSRLVSAYAEFVYARAAYGREKNLYEKEIGSRDDYLSAENAFKKANAEFAAARDTVAYETQRNLLEMRRARDVEKLALLGAERRLHVLGAPQEKIEELGGLMASPDSTPHEAEGHACTDPNCTNCKPKSGQIDQAPPAASVAASAEPEPLGLYPLRAPFDGVIINRHIALGESVSDTTDAFTVADLSSVWVDLKVYQRDLPRVAAGMPVAIAAANGAQHTTGRIRFVSPVVSEETRTAPARVVLPNHDGQWRPGLFVNGLLLESNGGASVVVPKDAVQVLDGEEVVFLAEANGFRPVPVVTGEADGERIKIRSGLSSGQSFVARGAFELKSQIITTGMDPHAGHGH